MAGLVGDLLSLARAESGARLEFGPVELDAVLLEAVRQAGPAAPHVRMEVDSLEPLVVQGDRDRLKELLLIVLDNAGRYTPAGGMVTASLRLEDQNARIDVSDTGIGIPEDDRPQVFERLYRGSGARLLRPSGTGLGLAIAKWIVEAHAGSITVSPRQAGGTVVSITLPAPGH
jgi:signal transduction histidine kinase